MKDATSPTDFQDKSTNTFAVTANGSTQIVSITGVSSPAAYLDGNSDFLQLPDDPDLAMGSGDFTVETWYYPTALGNDYGNPIIGGNEPGSFQVGWRSSSTFGVANSFVAWEMYTDAPPLNQWTHIAVSRQGSTMRMFYNGVLVLSESISTDYTAASRYIGGWSDYPGRLTGYIDDLRVTKGVARYTSNFMPPNGPLPTTSDPDYADVQLLLNMNSVGTTFTDQSNNNLTITRFGTPAITSDAPAFSRGNFAVLNGPDYLTIGPDPAFNLRDTDYTVECWVNMVSWLQGNAPRIISFENAGGSYGLLVDSTNPDLTFAYNHYGTGEGIVGSATPGWNHVALVQQGSNTSLYVNGINIGTIAVPTMPSSNDGNVKITIGGSTVNYEYQEFYGRIDDLRITKGVARYINNFIPPQSLPTEVGEIVGLKFVPSPSSALSNETISVTYPHTLVYVGKIDAINVPEECVLLSTQPDLYNSNSDQINMVFTRPYQSLMPYNGVDNQETGYLPDGSEWFYAAFSFLSNDTVRYAVYSPTQTLNGILDGSSSKQNYNGFITFGGGFGDPERYNVFGTVRAGMFINQAFETQTDMENLYNDIISGPVNDLGL